MHYASSSKTSNRKRLLFRAGALALIKSVTRITCNEHSDRVGTMTRFRRCTYTLLRTPQNISRSKIQQWTDDELKTSGTDTGTGELNLSWICIVSGRMSDDHRAVHMDTESQGHTQRRAETEKGLGRSLASSAGSNDHNARMDQIMHNAPMAQQTAV